jgi:hypothetical protein
VNCCEQGRRNYHSSPTTYAKDANDVAFPGGNWHAAVKFCFFSAAGVWT